MFKNELTVFVFRVQRTFMSFKDIINEGLNISLDGRMVTKKIVFIFFVCFLFIYTENINILITYKCIETSGFRVYISMYVDVRL